ncbi:hypothetical protein [Lacinutrix cladophorae]
MFEDFTTIIESFLVGAFPWISQLRGLDIHFKIPSFNLKSIFNFFASLFSLSIFLYMNRLDVYDFIYWPDWKLFIGIGFILMISYFVVLIYRMSDVNSNKSKWPIILNFITYILIFSCLTTGFGLLKTYKDHYVVKGIVVNNKEELIEKSIITLLYKNDSQYDVRTMTNLDGKYSLVIPKEIANDFNKLEVIKNGYKNYSEQFGNISALKSLTKKIILIDLN